MAENAVLAYPVINSPFDEPARHFKFDDNGITSEIMESRRSNAYFIPVGQCFVEVTEPWDGANAIRSEWWPLAPGVAGIGAAR